MSEFTLGYLPHVFGNIMLSIIYTMSDKVNQYYICGIDRDVEISNRIAERNMPSRPLQPQFSQRPVSTKYALMPIIDRRAPATVPIHTEPTFSVGTVFNPGNTQSPWSGFASNINDESTLRGQFFALQNCEQKEYVPSTKSDMYNVEVSGRKEVQPFPDLFQEQQFNLFNPNTCHLGNDLFNNSTRVQLMNSDCCDNNCISKKE